MTPMYEYLSQAQMENDFIKTHRKHRVRLSAETWLRCDTCAASLHFGERDARAVFKEFFTR